MTTPIREASSVILLKDRPTGFEVYLQRRARGMSFMGSAFVFPGGAAEANEDARTAAARELFEEAGILLAKARPVPASVDDWGSDRETMQITSLPDMRRRILAGADATSVLAHAGWIWAPDVMHPWSHWITPSIEPKRFSARFFICECPPGQEAKPDNKESVEQIWIRPVDALARAGELNLPPPQVRTCWELAHFATVADVMAAARVRSEEPHPILPRLHSASMGAAVGDPARAMGPALATTTGPCLLLPWDPDYTELGTGDAAPLAYSPQWATGPSRFVREGNAWAHVVAPGSTLPG